MWAVIMNLGTILKVVRDLEALIRLLVSQKRGPNQAEDLALLEDVKFLVDKGVVPMSPEMLTQVDSVIADIENALQLKAA